MAPRKLEATVGEGRQVTLPGELVEHFHRASGGHRPFDRLLFTIDDTTGAVSVRALHRGYAGIFAELYGDTDDEVQAYIDGERASWDG